MTTIYGKTPNSLLLFAHAILSGLLLNLSWAPHPYTALVFVALVPMLFVAKGFRQQPGLVFLALFTGFFVFHAGAAWWMYSSTFVGSLLAHLLNAFLPSAALVLWAVIPPKVIKPIGRGLLLVSIWLSMEWLNAVWPFAWPWFQLGHVFGAQPKWVQWYSLTSSVGGSAWVIMVNYLFFKSLSTLPKLQSGHLMVAIVTATAPILFSYLMPKVDQTTDSKTIAVVQPNIHPQREKFGGMDAGAQLDKAISLLSSAGHGTVNYVVFPETMIVEPIEESLMHESKPVRLLKAVVAEKKLDGIFTGAFTMRTKGADGHEEEKGKEVLYNSMLFISADSIQVYHKEKLVPLVEKQPLLWLFKPFRQFLESNGAYFGSYGTDNIKRYFRLDNRMAAIPLICFESAFACHPDQVPIHAFAVLVTNDGWWSSPGGYTQHLNLARIRAIERRIWVVRSANTGVSCLIDPQGEVTGAIGYGSEGLMAHEVFAASPVLLSCRSMHFMRWSALVLLLVALVMSAVDKIRTEKRVNGQKTSNNG